MAAKARRWAPAIFLCAFAAAVAGCQAGSSQGEGPGHRVQRLGLTPQQELQLGREAYREVLSHPEKYGHAMPSEAPEVRRVRGVVRRLLQAAAIKPLQREINLRLEGYRFEWEVNVLENRQRNAFCLPAGKIAVFTGILPVAETDDQLATVLSHEMAHALAHHASERIAREMGYEGAMQSGPVGILAGLFGKKYDRQQEEEADHIGLFLMTFAEYDAREAVRFWQRMQRATGGQAIPEILSDHPSDERRISDMERWIPQAEMAKRFFDEGRIEP